MPLNGKTKVFFLFFLIVSLLSCATHNKTVTLRKRNKSNSIDSYVPSSNLYSPIYKPNGGEKKQNIMNRGKVQREKEFIAILKSIPTPVKPKLINSNSEADKIILQAIESFNSRIYELENKLSKIDFSAKGSEQEYTEILLEINNLICNFQDGLSLLEKKVKKLYSDVSFDTGSSLISKKGTAALTEITSNIQQEVSRWQRYLNSCNKKIFENDLFILVVNIDGYADKRGSYDANTVLSKERAQAVELLLRDQLTSLIKTKGVKLVFNKVYSTGYGEKLPPDTIDGPDDDPNRRICVISYMVCPARYIKE